MGGTKLGGMANLAASDVGLRIWPSEQFLKGISLERGKCIKFSVISRSLSLLSAVLGVFVLLTVLIFLLLMLLEVMSFNMLSDAIDEVETW